MGAYRITPKPTNPHDIVVSINDARPRHHPHRQGIPDKEQVQVDANLAAVINDLETPPEAATNLEFEKAARLRDEVKRLREMELDTLTGEVS